MKIINLCEKVIERFRERFGDNELEKICASEIIDELCANTKANIDKALDTLEKCLVENITGRISYTLRMEYLENIRDKLCQSSISLSLLILSMLTAIITEIVLPREATSDAVELSRSTKDL